MKNIFFAFSIIALLLTSCKTKQYTPLNYEKEQLTFGNGGGFTGASVEYTLLSNGQLFKKAGDGYTSIATIDKNQAKQIFSNYTTLNMDKKVMNDPGNMYYFIKRKTPETLHKAVWGANPDVDQRMKIYFANLMKIVSESNEKSKECKTK